MKRKVSASILNSDLLHLADEVSLLEHAKVDMLHFDVMDGIFVPNLSFGIPVLQAVAGNSHLFMDVHLMIIRPHLYITEFAKAGADMITFHLESESDPVETIRLIHEAGCKAGISIKPGTPGEAVLPYLDMVENVLVMTVEPGFGGQSFIWEMTDKIHMIRDALGERDVMLQVDGGINDETVNAAVNAGADLLVAGSYLFKHPDMNAAVQLLRCGNEGSV
ncbi:MAG: ribulose-phosphate 3-epimerase [Oscillospiraceae bacterium]|nr:ribulose-phosphate 3-epimerase [Oscillospiraceae bacterium]